MKFKSLISLLINPFLRVAGWKALFWGLFFILFASHMGSYSNTCFDGVLDAHSGANLPYWVFMSAGVINWLCMGFIFFIIGKLSAKGTVRAIDVFGTQALARWPTIFSALITLPSAYSRSIEHLQKIVSAQKLPDNVETFDLVYFAVAVGVMLLVTVWVVVLMYKSYIVSCDPRVKKPVPLFVLGLVFAEIVSKGLIVLAVHL